ncbi:MAG: hypothetical protein AAGF11_28480 [Myxococcota bacterium]
MPRSPRRFGFYRRLSAPQRAVYRQSDAVTTLPLMRPERARPCVEAIAQALQADDRRAVERACNRLSQQLCGDLVVPSSPVKVLARRPADAVGELHGLYVRDEQGRTLIRVWMRTAAHERVVAFRTFLRTLLHELCHHLDFEHLELTDSFHTQGFFQRESSLMRQLAGPAPGRRADAISSGGPQQLRLPGLG